MKNRKDNMKPRKIKNIKKHITNMYKDVDREYNGTVYMFHNTVLNIMLFVNCKDGDEAAAVFDSCGFARRSDWKIFLELGQQPTDDPGEALH
tara:strand:- start:45 stop:320 length:276 start_codon:yes stop_codon:yes gene_type:complete